MTEEFLAKYSNIPITEGQLLFFNYQEKHLLSVIVKELKTEDPTKCFGVLRPNTAVMWSAGPSITIRRSESYKFELPHHWLEKLSKFLSADVDRSRLDEVTAGWQEEEREALGRAALSYFFMRRLSVDEKDLDDIQLTMEDFNRALENDMDWIET